MTPSSVVSRCAQVFRVGSLVASFALAGLMGCTRVSQGQEAPSPTDSTSAGEYSRSEIAPAALGPVPDFGLVAGIATNWEIEKVCPDLGAALDAICGAAHLQDGRILGAEVVGDGDDEPAGNALWMRDYQPLYVRRGDGELRALRYLSVYPSRSRYLPLSDPTGPPPGPGYRYHAFPGSAEGGRWVSTEVLPLLHENGNLVSTGRLVFLTDRILDDNAEVHEEPHLAASGYRPRPAAEVIDLLAAALGVSPEAIVILPRMPWEGTGHVDLFLMPIGPEVVVIPELRRQAIEMSSSDELRARSWWVATFLDERASEMEALGLTTIRLPMPPLAFQELPDEDGGDDLLFHSPANGILVALDNARYVVLPGLEGLHEAESMAPMEREYTLLWRDGFAQHGWTAVFVDARILGQGLGLLRCASAMIPR